ncbi:MAG: cysteine--tRNA ligase, partial [Planctomycetia bacterium]|nr:cysteine--tRNA ligase [Planctomycetia bacterium]
ELAQSESDTDKPFAKVWMHNGLLKLRSGKMAGSLGNVLNVADALTLVGGETLRFFILNTHYRSPIDLGDWEPTPGSIPSGLANAQKAFETFTRFGERYQRITGRSFFTSTKPDPRRTMSVDMGSYLMRFSEHMNDDFNTGGAVGVLFDLVTALNRTADFHRLESPGAQADRAMAEFEEGAVLLKELGQILGLFLQAPSQAKLAGGDQLAAGLMDLLIELRNNLRATAKGIADKADPTKKALFDQTDLIRQRLAALNVTLEDRPAGTTWRVG